MTDNKTSNRQKMTEKNIRVDATTPPKGQTTASSQEFEAAFRQGTILLHQGQAAEAVQHLEKALSLKTDDADVAINLSGAYIMSKKFKKAVAILEPLSRQSPDHAKVWINLGAAYLGNPVLARAEEQEKAIFSFERALEIDPIAPSVAYNIGLIYRDRKDNDKVAYWFRQAVKHNPRDKDARSMLRRLEAE